MKRLLVLCAVLLIAPTVYADGLRYDASFTAGQFLVTYCDTCVMTGLSGPISGSLGFTAGQLTGDGYLNLTLGQQSFALPAFYVVSTWEAPSSWYIITQANIPEMNAKLKVWLPAGQADVGCSSFGCNGVLPTDLSRGVGYLEIRDMTAQFDFDGPFDYHFHNDHYLNAYLNLTPMPMTSAAVPEPASLVLVGIGLLLLLYRHRYFRTKHQL